MGNTQHLVDGLLGENGAGSVVNNYLVIVFQLVLQEENAVAGGIVSGCSAFNNPLDLGNLEFVQDFLEVFNPILDADNENGVDILVLLEFFQGVNNDGFVL